MKLRDYQEQLVNAGLVELRTTGRALLVAATGAGKSCVIAEIVRQLGLRSLVLVPRVALVPQMQAVMPDAGVLCDAYKSESQGHVTIATVQTASRRRLSGYDLVCVDEAHIMGDAHYKLLQGLSPRMVLGLTAAPFTAVGPIYGGKGYWPPPAHEVGISELVQRGFLVRPRMAEGRHAFDVKRVSIVAGDYNQAELAQVVTPAVLAAQMDDALPRLEGRKQVLWVCINISHAEEVAAALKARGEHAEVYHSKQSMDDREEILEEFKAGSSRHVVSVTALSTGFDHPAADALVLMRPTRSACLYVQTVGRVLRTSPGKEDALILDYGQCVKNLGPLDRPRLNAGKGGGKKKADIEPTLTRTVACSECLTFYFPPKYEQAACPSCGHVNGAGLGDKKLQKKTDEASEILRDPGDAETERYAFAPIAPYLQTLSLEAMRVESMAFQLTGYELIVTFSCRDVGGSPHECKRVFMLPQPDEYSDPKRKPWAFGRARAIKTALKNWFGAEDGTVRAMINGLAGVRQMPEYVQADFALKFRHGNVTKAWGSQPMKVGRHEKVDEYAQAQVGLL
jgi:DNA repair protein RadD